MKKWISLGTALIIFLSQVNFCAMGFEVEAADVVQTVVDEDEPNDEEEWEADINEEEDEAAKEEIIDETVVNEEETFSKTELLDEVVSKDEYIIQDEVEFLEFVKAVNNGNSYEGQIVILKNNLDLSEQHISPIGSKENPFKGSFDGGGKEITGIRLAVTGEHTGLFGYIHGTAEKKSVISNVSLVYEENIVSYHDSGTGGIAGYAVHTEFQNCEVRGDIEIIGEERVGGIVGKGRALDFYDCSVNVSLIDGEGRLGGLAGVINYDIDDQNSVELIETVIKNSKVVADFNTMLSTGGAVGEYEGDITVENFEYTGEMKNTGISQDSGGIIGIHHGGRIRIETADIDINIEILNGRATNIGGIIGKYWTDTNEDSEIKDVSVRGVINIHSDDDVDRVGGLIGDIYKENISIHIEDIHNYLVIDVFAEENARSIGGAIGKAAGDTDEETKIHINNYEGENEKIIVKSGQLIWYVGGLIGEANAAMEVTNSNIELESIDIESEQVKGIAGFVNIVDSDSTVIIENCEANIDSIKIEAEQVEKTAGFINVVHGESIINIKGSEVKADAIAIASPFVEAVAGLVNVTNGGAAVNIADSEVNIDKIKVHTTDIVGLSGLINLTESESIVAINNTAVTADIIIESLSLEDNYGCNEIGGLIAASCGAVEIYNSNFYGDITIESTDFMVNDVGGVGVFIFDTEESIIKGSSHQGNISIEGSDANRIGGAFSSLEKEALIENVVSMGDIYIHVSYALDSIGGFTGVVGHESNTAISNCKTSGEMTISIEDDDGVRLSNIGGFAGIVGIAGENTGKIIENSIALDRINIVSSGSAQSAIIDLIGGFAGWVQDGYFYGNGANTEINIDLDLSNTAMVASIGGFAGYLEFSTNIEQCYAAGDIIINANAEAVSVEYVGGFVGSIDLNQYYYIQNSYATSDLIITANSEYDGNKISGVAGFIGDVRNALRPSRTSYHVNIENTYYGGEFNFSGFNDIKHIALFASSTHGEYYPTPIRYEACYYDTNKNIDLYEEYGALGHLPYGGSEPLGKHTLFMTRENADPNAKHYYTKEINIEPLKGFDFEDIWACTANNEEIGYYPQLQVFEDRIPQEEILKGVETDAYYFVSLDANGGGDRSGQEHYENWGLHGENVPSMAYYKEEKPVDHWNTEPDGTGKNYPLALNLTEDLLLYAMYDKLPEYSVQYNGNGASGNVPVDKNRYRYEETVTVLEKNGISKEGHSFTGWKSSLDGKVYKEGTTFKITDDTVMTAQWNKNGTVTPPDENDREKDEKQDPYVIYHSNWEENNIRRNFGPYSKGTVVEVKEGTIFKAPQNYKFVGWADKPEGIPVYYPKDKLTIEISDIHLYAVWELIEIPQLNKEDHYAYIAGYPDGTVKPENNVTREETVSIFFRLLTEESRVQYSSTVNPFTDVEQDRWSNKAISTLFNAGILLEKEGEFRPAEPITRGEAAIIAAGFDKRDYETDIQFSDIEGHYASGYIYKAAALGWLKGYPDGTFKPDAYITRAELVTLINQVLERTVVSKNHMDADMILWPDNMDESKWYYLHIQEATNSHSYTVENGLEQWTELIKREYWADQN